MERGEEWKDTEEVWQIENTRRNEVKKCKESFHFFRDPAVRARMCMRVKVMTSGARVCMCVKVMTSGLKPSSTWEPARFSFGLGACFQICSRTGLGGPVDLEALGNPRPTLYSTQFHLFINILEKVWFLTCCAWALLTILGRKNTWLKGLGGRRKSAKNISPRFGPRLAPLLCHQYHQHSV